MIEVAKRHWIVSCACIGAILGFTMILTHTGPGLKKPIPPSSPESRNEQRRLALTDLSKAIQAYMNDHGKLPIKLPDTETGICSAYGPNCESVKLIDLNFLVARTKPYIYHISSDPRGGYGRWTTGYTIQQYPDGSIRLSAPRSENDEEITVTIWRQKT
jgi:hypothetical protein